MSYLVRAVDYQLDQLLPYVGAIAIDGLKGVGKTETATRRSTEVLKLDYESGKQIIAADPEFRSLDGKTLLIDEWQKMPESWDYVRRAVDRGVSAGRFLLTGSATPVSGTDTHSGAGRILSLRMRPLALFERSPQQSRRVGDSPLISVAKLFQGNARIEGHTRMSLADYIHAMASSGFPGFYDAPEVVRNEQLDSYLRRIVDRDLPDQDYIVRNKAGLMRWLAAYAAATSTTTGYSEILDAATPGEGQKPAKTTTAKYREKLSEIWILDEIPAWDFIPSPFSGLAKTPKHHLADPAFVFRLLHISETGLRTQRFAHLLGPLFESLATLSVRVAVESLFGTVSHFRTKKGDREIDLIAQDQNGTVLAFEVKLSADVKDEDVRHLLWLKQKLPDDVVDMVILTTGSRAYRRKDGVAVVPLGLLGR